MSFPTRFLEAEARGRKIARSLLRMTNVDPELDDDALDRLGHALRERDEFGATLADAMRSPRSSDDHVSHRLFAEALREAPERHEDEPPALAHFLDQVVPVPEWVDWDRIERGAAAFRYLGRNAGDVLNLLSLVGGYRFGGPADLLVMTGGLSGDNTLRRLGETVKWTNAVTRPGGLRPGAEGWRLTVHVRAMHALVNAGYEERWDSDRWGLPINQSDQAGTLGLFDATVLLGCLGLGVPMTRQQRDDYMHMWRYVGWLMGVHPDFLTDDEEERHTWNYHVLVTAADQTQPGRDLARLTMDAQAQRAFGHDSPWLERLHQRFERARQLSILTAFIGLTGMRELGLRPRLPWGWVLAVAWNTLQYRVLGNVERLEARGAKYQMDYMDSMFRGSPADVATLPA